MDGSDENPAGDHGLMDPVSKSPLTRLAAQVVGLERGELVMLLDNSPGLVLVAKVVGDFVLSDDTEIVPVGSVEELLADGGVGSEGVKRQEQTDEISDGLLHFETNLGSPVVAALIVVVYVAQKGPARLEVLSTCL